MDKGGRGVPWPHTGPCEREESTASRHIMYRSVTDTYVPVGFGNHATQSITKFSPNLEQSTQVNITITETCNTHAIYFRIRIHSTTFHL